MERENIFILMEICLLDHGSWIIGKKIGFGVVKIIEENNHDQYIQFWYDDKLLDSIKLDIDVDENDDIETFLTNIFLLNEKELDEEMKDKITCPISHDYILIPVRTSCNHIFCKLNLQKISNNQCPLCRQNIEYYIDVPELSSILDKCQFSFDGKNQL